MSRFVPVLILASLVGSCGDDRERDPAGTLVQVETYEEARHRGGESPLRLFEDGRATFWRANYASNEHRLHVGRWWQDADLRIIVFRTLRVITYREDDDEPEVETRSVEKPLVLVIQDDGADTRCIADNFDRKFVDTRWRRVRVEFADLTTVARYLRGSLE